MNKKGPLLGEYTKGLWDSNPVIKQSLGLCPALAVTVTALNGLAMGLATTFVLVFSSLIVSLIRHWIPRQVRIAAHIVIIATFVTIVDLVMKARFPALSSSLGPYIPLIVVNCLILGRQEMFASKNQPVRAVLDGFGVGTGFLVVLFTLGGVREVIGSGTFLGAQVMPAAFQPWLIMVLPGGAFLTLGVLMGLANAYVLHRQKVERQGQQTKLAGTVEKEVAV
jgi:Na+-translocating ferredoxin:NAD+ oxidoreductase subunit E